MPKGNIFGIILSKWGVSIAFIKYSQLMAVILKKNHIYFPEYRGNQNSVKWDDSVSPDIKGQYCLIDISQMTILFEEM